jgi:3-methyladenine DNA glycosylase AlkC
MFYRGRVSRSEQYLLMNDAQEKKAFKDWFDKQAASALAEQFQRAWPPFDKKVFLKSATAGLETLEFQARVRQFSQSLRLVLPDDLKETLRILEQSLPPRRQSCEETTAGWLQWPLGQFIADYGLDQFHQSMETMVELTQCFTAEFAVRPFVENYPEQTFARLGELTVHPNPHVRRWCSEGTRPRLPWGKKLVNLTSDPTPIWPILEALKDDPELYVRRSVANNLNDISKDHPDAVVELCLRWKQDAGIERSRLIRHALRTLLKDGHQGALRVLGYETPRDLSVSLEIEPKIVKLGDQVGLTVTILNGHGSAQKLMLDYLVDYPRKNGKRSSKVFKWTTLEPEPGQKITSAKNHPMKKTTVRQLYPGVHGVAVQVNGVVKAQGEFEFRGVQ